MWISWLVSVKRDPGFLPVNTENYSQIIRGVLFGLFFSISVFIPYSKTFVFYSEVHPLFVLTGFYQILLRRFHWMRKAVRSLFHFLGYVTRVAALGRCALSIVVFAIAVSHISTTIVLL